MNNLHNDRPIYIQCKQPTDEMGFGINFDIAQSQIVKVDDNDYEFDDCTSNSN